MTRLAAVFAVSAVALAGCGGSQQRPAGARTTVPAYGSFPADTISVDAADPAAPACGVDARAFAVSSRRFVTQVPADTYYMVMREELADFRARRCDPTRLGRELRRGLTRRQRAALVANLPRELAAFVQAGLASAAGG
jgi:hypothetical protein